MKFLIGILSVILFSALSSPSLAEDCIVKLYDDSGFTDRVLTINCYQNMENLENVRSDSGELGFNDKTSSVKYKIPPGWEVVLFEDSSFRNRPFALKGNGQVSDMSYFNDKTSSVKWRKAGTDTTAGLGDNGCIVKLWDDAGFTDRFLTVFCKQDIPDMNLIKSDSGELGFNDKTSSLKYRIPPGWEVVLYEDDHYRNRSYVLKGEGAIKFLGYFNDKPSSLKWRKAQ